VERKENQVQNLQIENKLQKTKTLHQRKEQERILLLILLKQVKV